VKLIDFGWYVRNYYLSHLFSAIPYPIEESNSFYGNLYYAAPEVILRKSDIGAASDVWSLGCVLFELATGYKPFCTPHKAVEREFMFDWKSDEEGLSEECKDLLDKMLCIDPLQRISTEEILEHPWLN
jgi:serine/threonine protein kinase